MRWRASRGARPSAGWWCPAQDDAALILGHTADTAADLRQALLDGTLMDRLVTVPVAQDDFFMVNAGEVHSVGPGMLVYEVQQSSDITYRLYDFDRVGPDGKPRELHVDKGFSVVSAPHDPAAARTAGPWEQIRPRRTHPGAGRLPAVPGPALGAAQRGLPARGARATGS